MNCIHVNDLLSQFADGDLPANTRAQVEQHLRGDAHAKPCADCTARLDMLQSALVLLQTDAQTDAQNTRDLYGAFRQRLVTQPVRASRLPTRLRWLPQFGIAALGLCAVAGGRYYRQHRYDATFDMAIEALNRPIDNVHFTDYETSVEADGRIRSNTSDYWLEHGYTLSNSLNQNAPASPSAKTTPADFTQYHRYGLPGGVDFAWRQPSRRHLVRLYWSPRLSQGQDNLAWYAMNDARTFLTKLRDEGNIQAAGVHITRERSGGVTLLRIRVDHFKQAVPPEPTGVNNNLPVSFSVWLDNQNRIREYDSNRYYATARTNESSSYIYEYGRIIPTAAYNKTLDVPNLPADSTIVVSDNKWNGNTVLEVDRVVTPVWMTMAPAEKLRVQDAIDRWADAWKARDADRLRESVDLDWPCQVFRPAGRTALNAPEVWRQLWAERLASEQHWQKFAPQVLFAYQTENFQVNEAPTAKGLNSENRCLPGLNALCLIWARQADGTSSVFPARLCLVNRGSGWKVFYYRRMAAPLSMNPETNP